MRSRSSAMVRFAKSRIFSSAEQPFNVYGAWATSVPIPSSSFNFKMPGYPHGRAALHFRPWISRENWNVVAPIFSASFPIARNPFAEEMASDIKHSCYLHMNFFLSDCSARKSNSAGTLKISLFLSSHRFQEKTAPHMKIADRTSCRMRLKRDPVIRDQIPSLTPEKVPDLKSFLRLPQPGLPGSART